MGSWLGSGRPGRLLQLLEILRSASISRIKLQGPVEVATRGLHPPQLPLGDAPVHERVRVGPAAADRPVKVPKRLPRAVLLQQERAEVVVEAGCVGGEAEGGRKRSLGPSVISGLGQSGCEVVHVVGNKASTVHARGTTWRRRVARQLGPGDDATAFQGLEVDVVRPMDCQNDVVAKHQRIEHVPLFGKGQYRSDHRGTGSVPIHEYIGDGVLDWARCRPGRGQSVLSQQSVDHAARVRRRTLLITGRRLKPQRLGSSPRTIDSFEPQQVSIESEEGVDKKWPLHRFCSVGDHAKQTMEESRSKRQRQKETTMTKVRSRMRHHAQQAGRVSAMSLTLGVLAALALTPALAEIQNDQIGFTPNHVFEGGIGGESVDVMSGNVNIRIPIGPRYKVNDWFGYQLELYYNSKIWEHDCPSYQTECHGALRHPDGFGQGFRLSFGRIYRNALDRTGVYRYQSPDGSEHYFCTDTTHCSSDEAYSPDAASIYFQPIANGWAAYPGDGTKVLIDQFIGGAWYASRIETIAQSGGTAQGFVAITYCSDSGCKANSIASITDSTERTIDFDNSAVHTTITLPVGSGTAQYQLWYDEDPIEEPFAPQPSGSPQSTNQRRLDRVVLPGLNANTESYRFWEYDTHGQLTHWQLPTGAEFKYTYVYSRTSKGHPLHVSMRNKEMIVDGVSYKWAYNRFGEGSDIGGYGWSTQHTDHGLESELQIAMQYSFSNPYRVLVWDPFENVTVYYYEASPFNQGDCNEEGCPTDWKDGMLWNVGTYAGPVVTPARLVQVESYSHAFDNRWMRFRDGGTSAVANHKNAIAANVRTAEKETLILSGSMPATTHREVYSNWSNQNPSNGSFLPGVSKPRTVEEFASGQRVRSTYTAYSGDHQFQDKHDRVEVRDGNGGLVASTVKVWTNVNRVKCEVQFATPTPSGTIAGCQDPSSPSCCSGPLSLSAGDVGTRHEFNSEGNLTKEVLEGGDDGLSWEADYTYLNGVLRSKQFSPGIGWKALDRDVDVESGSVTASRDPSGIETTYTWDALGRLKSINPESPELPTIIDYPNLRQTIVRRDVSSSDYTELEYVYDGLGRVITEYRRNRLGGRDFRLTDYEKFTARISRQSEWAPEGTDEEDLAWTTFEYRIFEDPAAPQGTTGEVDPLGRPSRVTRPDGSTIRTTYDGLAKTVTVGGIQGSTGPISAATTYVNDELGRLVSVDSPSPGADASYVYDEQDNLTEVRLSSTGQTNPQVRRFVYDAVGRLRTATNPENGTVDYLKYDARGNLVQWRDARQLEFINGYDAASRLWYKDLHTASGDRPLVENTYDVGVGYNAGPAESKLTQQISYRVANGSSQWVTKKTFAYGPDSTTAALCTSGLPGVTAYPGLNGRVRWVHTKVAPWSVEFETAYCQNSLGLTAMVAYPDTSSPRSKVWSLYSNGQLWNVHDAGRDLEYVSNVSYEAHGAPTEIVRHSTGDVIARDSQGRPLRYNVWELTSSGVNSIESVFGCSHASQPPYELMECNHVPSGSAGALLWDSGEYAYDGAGNIKQIGSDSYTYDRLQRLVGAIINPSSNPEMQALEGLGYDAFGNMTSDIKERSVGGFGMSETSTFGVDLATNRLISKQTNNQQLSYLYDPSGNLIQETGRRFVYDEQGRMVQLWDSDDQLVATYDYDAAGYRVRSVVDGVEAFYLRDEAGAVLTEYRRALGLSTPPTWDKNYIYALGQAVSMVKNQQPGLTGKPWATGVSANGLTLNWHPVSDEDVGQYHIQRKVGIATTDYYTNAAVTSLADSFAGIVQSSSTSIKYSVQAIDTAMNSSAPSPFLIVRPFSTDPEPIPSNLAAEPQDKAIRLTWSAVSGDDLAGYILQRDGQPINPHPVAATEFIDFGLVNGTTYTYRVLSIDTSGRQSQPSSPVTASPRDNVPPARPVGVQAAPGLAAGTIVVTWLPNLDTDVAGYHILRGASAGGLTPLPGNVTGTSFVDTATPGQTWYYAVTAYDTSNPANESQPSDVTSSRARLGVDSIAPPELQCDDPHPLPYCEFKVVDHGTTSIDGLAVFSGAYRHGCNIAAEDDDEMKVLLSWRIPGQHPAGYRVYRADGQGSNYVQVGGDLAGGLGTYSDTVSGPEYSYYVVALKNNGSVTEESGASSVYHVVAEYDPGISVRNVTLNDGRVAYTTSNRTSRRPRISWSRVVSPYLVGYHVYRRADWGETPGTLSQPYPVMRQTEFNADGWIRLTDWPTQFRTLTDTTLGGLGGNYEYAVRPVWFDGTEGPIGKILNANLINGNLTGIDDDACYFDEGTHSSEYFWVLPNQYENQQPDHDPTITGDQEIARINGIGRGSASPVGPPPSPTDVTAIVREMPRPDTGSCAGHDPVMCGASLFSPAVRTTKYIDIRWGPSPEFRPPDLAGYHIELAGSASGPWRRVTIHPVAWWDSYFKMTVGVKDYRGICSSASTTYCGTDADCPGTCLVDHCAGDPSDPCSSNFDCRKCEDLGEWSGHTECLHVRVIAIDQNGNESGPTDAAADSQAYCPATPAAPKNLRASTVYVSGNAPRTRLEWDPVPNATTYYIYRYLFPFGLYFYKTQVQPASCTGLPTGSACGTTFVDLGDGTGGNIDSNLDCPSGNTWALGGSLGCGPYDLDAYYVTAAAATGGESPRSDIVFWNPLNTAYTSKLRWQAPQDNYALLQTCPVKLESVEPVCETSQPSIMSSWARDRGLADKAAQTAPLVTLGLAAGAPPYQVYDLHVDHLGSTRLENDSSGTVTSRHDFFPFGEDIAPMADYATKLFTGHERDKESGLDYMMARYYSPRLARFLCTDPGDDTDSEDVQAWNQFVYVKNNPLNLTDPTGMYGVGEFLQDAGDFVIGALRGAAASVSNGAIAGSTPQSGDSNASLLGQLAGSAGVTVGGVVTSAAGTTEAVVTSPAAVTVVGAAIPAAGVAVAAAGATAAVGGATNMARISEAAKGQSASGQATDEHGSKLGGSGKPQVHTVEHSTQKAAKDAARLEGAGKPVKHPSPQKGRGHYHPTGGDGKKKPASTHHSYPKR